MSYLEHSQQPKSLSQHQQPHNQQQPTQSQSQYSQPMGNLFTNQPFQRSQQPLSNLPIPQHRNLNNLNNNNHSQFLLSNWLPHEVEETQFSYLPYIFISNSANFGSVIWNNIGQSRLNQSSGNPLGSRSNSIFSSLINIPGSNGNSISEQSGPSSQQQQQLTQQAASAGGSNNKTVSSGNQAPNLPLHPVHVRCH